MFTGVKAGPSLFDHVDCADFGQCNFGQTIFWPANLAPLWGRRGFTRQPENSKRAHFRVPAFKHHQNSTKSPKENCGGKGKKWDPPPPQAPHFSGFGQHLPHPHLAKCVATESSLQPHAGRPWVTRTTLQRAKYTL